MITVRKASERGTTRAPWLESYHTFSFNNYFDPENMGFSDLRVINEDFVKEGTGFGTHSHRDMEIITYVLSGTVQHRDSTGGSGLITPGEVQRMTAGTGVSHSEFNHSKEEPVHLLQIWILPEKQGLKPGYEQRMFPVEERTGKFRLVASRDGRDGSLTIHQDAALYAGNIKSGDQVNHEIAPGRKAWVQIAKGSATIGDITLNQGDAAAVTGETLITLKAGADAEVLMFDLA
jgi:redox-sensitive bicupin YhaK (pirin superfamily)